MRVAFMGTPDFAVGSLEAVSAVHEVVLVVTRPDVASGRGAGLVPSPVRATAERLGLPVAAPESARSAGFAQIVRDARPDVVCVVAYGLILPAEVLGVPRLGCVNVHASLLPRWRGAAPIQRAILAGDKVTGVSVMRMEAGLDAGPVCLVRTADVDRHDCASLTTLLAEEGAAALVAALESMESGEVAWTAQDDSAATYAEKVTREDVAIEPSLAVAAADRRVRASSPSAPCRVRVGGRSLTVLRAEPRPGAATAPGTVLADRSGVALGCADGWLALTAIRPDGKSEMGSAAWANGARIEPGERWDRA